MWRQMRPYVTGVVMWIVKNHWMFLVVMISLQYFTGKAMAVGWWFFGLDPRVVLQLHLINGTLIVLAMLLMAGEKGYLWLLKKGRI